MRLATILRATARCLVTAALVATMASCGGGGGSFGSGSAGDGGGSGGDSGTASSTKSDDEPDGSSTTGSGSDKPSDKTIVAYQVLPAELSDQRVDVTFTNQDGDTETQPGVSLPWSGGSFVPVGARVSLSAKTNWVGRPAFSCRLRLNGVRHEGKGGFVTQGNDIVGYECHVGPVTAKPFP